MDENRTDPGQSPFVDWLCYYRVKSVFPFRFTRFYRVKSVYIFRFMRFLQGQSCLSFSINKVFTGSNQSPIFDFQFFNSVKWLLLSSIFRDLTCYWHNFWTLFTVFLHDLASRTFTFYRIVSMFYMLCS